MKPEAELIAAICRTKDMESFVSAGIDNMIDPAYNDVLHEIIAHWHRYEAVPEYTTITEKFPELMPVDAKEPVDFYINKVKESHIKAKMRESVSNVGKNLTSGGQFALSRLIDELNVIARDTGVVQDLDISDVDAAIADYEQRAKDAENGVLGIRTGIEPFDASYPTGLAGGHFISVIGWSGYGKTAFTTYLAANAWRSGKTVLFVSLEMSSEQMRDRIITTLGDGAFNGNKISRGQIDVDQFEKWGRANLDRPNRLIVISSEGQDSVTMNTVQAKIDQYKPDIVILDYIQLFDDAQNGGNETVKIRNISKDAKRMALRNDIPIVGITQATQDNKSDLDNPPLIEQVAWSKGIQHDSDLAIAAHKRPTESYMEVIARKNRHGPLFGFYLDVDMENGKWEVRYDTPEGEVSDDDAFDIDGLINALGKS